jgi:hypothetical protein
MDIAITIGICVDIRVDIQWRWRSIHSLLSAGNVRARTYDEVRFRGVNIAIRLQISQRLIRFCQHRVLPIGVM